MAYRKIYFRIRTGCYNSGWSSDADRAAFKEESRTILTAENPASVASFLLMWMWEDTNPTMPARRTRSRPLLGRRDQRLRLSPVTRNQPLNPKGKKRPLITPGRRRKMPPNARPTKTGGPLHMRHRPDTRRRHTPPHLDWPADAPPKGKIAPKFCELFVNNKKRRRASNSALRGAGPQHLCSSLRRSVPTGFQ